jgi:AcrR family transcriptional regulator
VAREAGVGVGTVYRRFPDKESLIQELFRDRIDAMVRAAEQALTEPDPWQALVSYLEFAIALMASNMGLRQLLMFSTYGKERIHYARSQMHPVIAKLVERAQASGDLRPDFAGTDVKMIGLPAGRVAALPRAAHRRAPARPRHRLRAARPGANGGRPRDRHVHPRPAPRPAPLTSRARRRAGEAQPGVSCTCSRTDDSACIFRCIISVHFPRA